MSNTETVTINTGDEAAKGPSIEEQYKALQAEGLVDPTGDVPGQKDAQGGAEPGAGEGADDNDASSVPEKFRNADGSLNAEALLKSYQELERSKSRGEPSDNGETPESVQATPEERKAAEDATQKAGLNLQEVSAEWWSNGGLKDETYTKLADAGYPKEMVDIYIEGLTGRTTQVVDQVHALFGGDEDGAAAYDEMAEWAADNLSDAEIEAYDRAVNSGNAASALIAVRGLKAQWEATLAADADEEPEETVTAKGGKVSGNVYTHPDEYMADLNDERYETNEAFRRQVMSKLARSNI